MSNCYLCEFTSHTVGLLKHFSGEDGDYNEIIVSKQLSLFYLNHMVLYQNMKQTVMAL